MVRKKSVGRKMREAEQAKAILMLNAQGYTIRQIIVKLQEQGIMIKSTRTVFNYLKAELGKAAQENMTLAEELKAQMVAQTSELMGMLAPHLEIVTIEEVKGKKVQKLSPNLEVVDRMLKVMDRRAIYIGFTQRTEHSGQVGLDLNLLRTARKRVTEKEKELELDPQLTGRVR